MIVAFLSHPDILAVLFEQEQRDEIPSHQLQPHRPAYQRREIIASIIVEYRFGFTAAIRVSLPPP